MRVATRTLEYRLHYYFIHYKLANTRLNIICKVRYNNKVQGYIVEAGDHWIGRLPWNPDIPGSRPVLITRWICSWYSQFNFPATLVNRQLVCSGQLGFWTVVVVVFCRFVHCVSLALKAPMGSDQLSTYCIVLFHYYVILPYLVKRTLKIWDGITL